MRARLTRLTRLAALGAVVTVLLGTGASAGAVTPAAPATGPVVLIGTGGITWIDVTEGRAPELAAVVGAPTSSAAALVVRTVAATTCPADGWLTLGAGRRSLAAAGGASSGATTCAPVGEPDSAGLVPGWAEHVTATESGGYGARPGLLGDLLSSASRTVATVGPGAALALAGTDGRLDGPHAPSPAADADLAAAAVSLLTAPGEGPRPDLLVVDVGAAGPGGAGPGTVTGADARIGAVLHAVEAASPEATIVIASLADTPGATDPRLQVLLVRGPATATIAQPAPDSAQLLGSTSTRQPGLVQNTDLTPTVLGLLGLADAAEPRALVGSPITATTGAPEAGAAAHLADLTLRADAVLATSLGYFAVVALLVLGLGTLTATTTIRRATSAWLRPAAIVVAAIPAATFLAALVPWWRVDAPGAGLALTVGGLAAALAALTALPAVRRRRLGPLVVVAGVTTAVLLGDALTGSRLMLDSPLGVFSLVAGRFYGFNNSAFALLAVASLLGAAACAGLALRHGRRHHALAAVVGVGVLVTVVDGTPGLGSDFGGPLALVVAFTLLALRVTQVRLTWRRVLAVLAGATVVVTAFGVADWLRPPGSRTHLGRFVEQVLAGDLLDTVTRKIEASLTALTIAAPALLVLAALVVVAALRVRRRARSGSPAGRTEAICSHLRATLAPTRELGWGVEAAAVALGIGVLLNDSGVAIAAIGLMLGIPLLLSVRPVAGARPDIGA